MKTTLLALGLAAIGGAAAAACPDYSQPAAVELSLTAAEIAQGYTLDYPAGGPNDLSTCEDFDASVFDGLPGHYIEGPDLRLFLTGLSGESLVISGFGNEEGCDVQLLVNAYTGEWLHNDDSGGGFDSMVAVTDAGDGQYDIWFGTALGYICSASTLTLEFAKG